MADESKKAVSTIIKVVLGIALIVLGVVAIYKLWDQLVTVVQGCVGLFLVLAGLITLAIAKE